MMRVSVIIPALNEEASIGWVVEHTPMEAVYEIIVVDNDSTDRTAEVAARAGARVIRESARGYGRACLAGARAAQGDIVVFLDGDGSFDPSEIARVVQPLVATADRADLVVGSRELSGLAPGAMPPHQRFGNRLAVLLLRWLYGLRVTDLGPFRALRRDDLLALGMTEMTYGWPIEMMIKAAKRGYRLVEAPVNYRPRLGGQSKVSGNLRGSIRAGYRIVRTILSQLGTPKGPTSHD